MAKKQRIGELIIKDIEDSMKRESGKGFYSKLVDPEKIIAYGITVGEIDGQFINTLCTYTNLRYRGERKELAQFLFFNALEAAKGDDQPLIQLKPQII